MKRHNRIKFRARRPRIPHPVHARPRSHPLRLDEFLTLAEFWLDLPEEQHAQTG